MISSAANYESGNSDDRSEATKNAQGSSSDHQLIKSPPASPSATATTSVAADHERQTLLLMLLAQVCSLHDATPRTFVVHVLALFERGILDSNSIRFLFDLGLVPRGYSEQFDGCFDDVASEAEVSNGDFRSSSSSNNGSDNNFAQNDTNQTASEIVPYAANNSQQHLWMRHLPPPPPIHNNGNSSRKHQSSIASRQSQVSAIRRHLAHQESIDSASSSVFGSANAGFIPGISSAATTSSINSSQANSQNRSSRKNSSSAASKNTLSSVDESFHSPYYENGDSKETTQSQDQFEDHEKSNNATHTQQLLTSNNAIPASWSVEQHPLSLSRYQREFHQLALLATGSFGSVYHAIHKLEHKPYAVKRVTFSTTGYYANTLALVIREVRCLAQLDHKNCVRYYTSWLEPSWMTGGDQLNGNKVMEEDDEDQSEDNLHRSVGRNANGPKLLSHIERVVDEINNSTGEAPLSMQRLETILYGEDTEGSVDDGFDWDPVSSNDLQRHDELPSHRTKNNVSVYSYESGDDNSDSDVSDWTQDMNSTNASSGLRRQGSLEIVPAHQQKAGATAAPYKYQICLFIQMQLCHPTTLADWIKERNHSCTKFDAQERQARARPAFEIFRQICHGLAHVHSKGIIHRDLKPANIFASDDGTWMVGDFGLSKMMRDAQGGVDIDLHNSEIILPNGYTNGGAQHTAGIGTASYAAPEQITRKHYDSSVDIFSLGLILLELFSNFTSEHERAVAFHDCRYHGELASWMKRTYPDVSSLVLACTQKDWAKRPTASEILSADVFQEGMSGVELYRAELKALNQELVIKDDLIQSQNDVIQSQNLELAEKDELIQQLKNRLESAGINISDLNID